MSENKRTYKKVRIGTFKKDVTRKDGKVETVIDSRLVADVFNSVELISKKINKPLSFFDDMSGQEIYAFVLKEFAKIELPIRQSTPTVERVINSLEISKDTLTAEQKKKIKDLLGL